MMNTNDAFKTMLVSITPPRAGAEPTNQDVYWNVLASHLLCGLIELELRARNQLTDPAVPGAGILLFPVEDVRTAAALAWSFLQGGGLDCWATIFRFDGDELIWRSIYPRTGIGLRHSDLAAQCAIVLRKLTQALALYKEANGH